MADLKEYEVTDFNYQDKEGKSFKDDNGNTWCTVVLLGVSEPVRWVVKDPAKVSKGDKVFGRITDETSKAGKPYLRFRREAKQEAVTDTQNNQSDEYWTERNSAIKAQWAINQSREYIQHMLEDKATLAEILDTAKIFYGMVDQVVNPIDENDRDIINLKDVPL